MKDRIGEIRENTNGTKMKIIKYIRSDNMYVEFQDSFKYVVNCQYKEFKLGKIKNPYDKKVFGVGYLGVGDYLPYKDKEKTKAYCYWVRMLQRCYSEEYQTQKPTYKNKYVCDDWLCFQNFAKWFEKNYYEINELGKTELDKDILYKGNTVYSPETCIFVPKRINQLFLKSNASRGNLPIGVSENSDSNSFRSRLHTLKGEVYLGSFSDKFEAHKKYKIAKEKYIKEVANEYKNIIPNALYNSMYKYEVDIND
ncbi:AP2 domain-containing protein [Clostridium beijerinckii]|uniref:AP2 domain-containing protein n=1 Tax=Clostridium beijerinckii TaxID=1520 RepID=UPI00156F1E0C|nr:AP2 domain-containing protein [Clostridium beijerinckii]NRU52611.1 hypothetical protein [Clostridium beijerinckii]NYC68654.1 hypothetical protein [Clostridium beijerinckii]NYC91803.1 hypothetical protein [Clostridium beijerinckii]